MTTYTNINEPAKQHATNKEDVILEFSEQGMVPNWDFINRLAKKGSTDKVSNERKRVRVDDDVDILNVTRNVMGKSSVPISTSSSRSYADVLRKDSTGRGGPTPQAMTDAPTPSFGGSSNAWFSDEEMRKRKWWSIPKLADIFRISVGRAAHLYTSYKTQMNIIQKMERAIKDSVFPNNWKMNVGSSFKGILPCKDKYFEEFKNLEKLFFISVAELKLKAAQESKRFILTCIEEPILIFNTVFESIKKEFPEIFSFVNEKLSSHFSLRLSEAKSDFAILFEDILIKIAPNGDENNVVESSVSEDLDTVIINTFQDRLKGKKKEDVNGDVVKSSPMVVLNEEGTSFINEINNLKKEVVVLKKAIKGKKPFAIKKNNNFKPIKKQSNFVSKSAEVKISNSGFKSGNRFVSKGKNMLNQWNNYSNCFVKPSKTSLKVDWATKALLAKANLCDAVIKSNGKVIKFNPKVPIADLNAIVKIGNYYFWRNGSLVNFLSPKFQYPNKVSGKNH